jgi:hypothetical protein
VFRSRNLGPSHIGFGELPPNDQGRQHARRGKVENRNRTDKSWNAENLTSWNKAVQRMKAEMGKTTEFEQKVTKITKLMKQGLFFVSLVCFCEKSGGSSEDEGRNRTGKSWNAEKLTSWNELPPWSFGFQPSAFQHFSVSAFVLGSGMNETSKVGAGPVTPEKLALAQEAFERFHSRCFWFMREDLRVREEDLEAIVRGLRAHGNREAFLLAAKLCR